MANLLRRNRQIPVELVKALAWPVAFIAVVLIFKGKFASLIDRLKNFDGLGVKASFSEEVKKVEAEVEQLKIEATLNAQDESDTMAATAHFEPLPNSEHAPEVSSPSIEPDNPIINYLLLHANPVAGFHLGRACLERALVDRFAAMTGTVPGMLLPMEELVVRLEEKRYINAKMRRTIKELLPWAIVRSTAALYQAWKAPRPT